MTRATANKAVKQGGKASGVVGGDGGGVFRYQEKGQEMWRDAGPQLGQALPTALAGLATGLVNSARQDRLGEVSSCKPGRS
jgi:hypothetical protein